MEFQTRSRINILIEAPFLRRVMDLLDAEDVEGYTVLPALAGKGEKGRWNRDGMVTDVDRQVLVYAVMEPERVDAVLAKVSAQLSGSVTLMTVEQVQLVL